MILKRSLAVLLSASLLWTSGDFAQAAAPLSPLAELTPPTRLGQVIDSFNLSNPTAQRVILIQDLHAHYGVQKNIAGILEYLSKQLQTAAPQNGGTPEQRHPGTAVSGSSNNENHSQPLRNAAFPGSRLSGQPTPPFVLAVEGASGPVDSSVMALFPDQKIKQAAADYLMREGELSGAEYFTVMRSEPKGLVGVEDERYYTLHRELFRKTWAKREQLTKALKSIQADLLALRRTVYSKPLKRFQSREDAFQAGKLGFGEYFDFLAAEAKETGMEFQRPDLSRNGAIDQAWEQTETLSYLLKIQKAQTPQEKDLVQVEHDLGFLINVANLQATEREVRTFGPRINQFVALANALTHKSFDEATLRELISSSIDYYAFALARNKPLVENTLALLDRSATQPADHQPLRTAVLVAGGFHTRQMTDILKSRGIAYAVIAPNLDKVSTSDQDLYVKRLNGQLLTEQEIIAAAPQWPESPTQLARSSAGDKTALAVGAGLVGAGVFLTAALSASAHGAPLLQHLPDFRAQLGSLTNLPVVQEWIKHIPVLLTGAGIVGMATIIGGQRDPLTPRKNPNLTAKNAAARLSKLWVRSLALVFVGGYFLPTPISSVAILSPAVLLPGLMVAAGLFGAGVVIYVELYGKNKSFDPRTLDQRGVGDEEMKWSVAFGKLAVAAIILLGAYEVWQIPVVQEWIHRIPAFLSIASGATAVGVVQAPFWDEDGGPSKATRVEIRTWLRQKYPDYFGDPNRFPKWLDPFTKLLSDSSGNPNAATIISALKAKGLILTHPDEGVIKSIARDVQIMAAYDADLRVNPSQRKSPKTLDYYDRHPGKQTGNFGLTPGPAVGNRSTKRGKTQEPPAPSHLRRQVQPAALSDDGGGFPSRVEQDNSARLEREIEQLRQDINGYQETLMQAQAKAENRETRYQQKREQAIPENDEALRKQTTEVQVQTMKIAANLNSAQDHLKSLLQRQAAARPGIMNDSRGFGLNELVIDMAGGTGLVLAVLGTALLTKAVIAAGTIFATVAILPAVVVMAGLLMIGGSTYMYRRALRAKNQAEVHAAPEQPVVKPSIEQLSQWAVEGQPVEVRWGDQRWPKTFQGLIDTRQFAGISYVDLFGSDRGVPYDEILDARLIYDDLLLRVKGNFNEEPGLRLTAREAARLIGIDQANTERLLQDLQESGYLTRNRDGAYVRNTGSGYGHPVSVANRPGIMSNPRGFGLRPFVHGWAGILFLAVAVVLINPLMAAGTFTGWPAVIGIVFALAGIGNFIAAFMTADTPTRRQESEVQKFMPGRTDLISEDRTSPPIPGRVVDVPYPGINKGKEMPVADRPGIEDQNRHVSLGGATLAIYGDTMMSIGQDGQINKWYDVGNVGNKWVFTEVVKVPRPMTSLAISGKYMISIGQDGQIYQWYDGVHGWSIPKELKVRQAMTSLVISGKTMMSIGQDGQIYQWYDGVHGWSITKELKVPREMTSLAISGKTMMSIGRDGQIYQWYDAGNVGNRWVFTKVLKVPQEMTSLAISGKTMMSIGQDGQIYQWRDYVDGWSRKEVLRVPQAMTSLAISGDAMISIGQDGQIYQWYDGIYGWSITKELKVPQAIAPDPKQNLPAAQPGTKNVQRGFGLQPFVHGLAGIGFLAAAGVSGWASVSGIIFALAGAGNFIAAFMTADTPTKRLQSEVQKFVPGRPDDLQQNTGRIERVPAQDHEYESNRQFVNDAVRRAAGLLTTKEANDEVQRRMVEYSRAKSAASRAGTMATQYPKNKDLKQGEALATENERTAQEALAYARQLRNAQETDNTDAAVRPAGVDSPAVKPGAVRQETLDAQIQHTEQYVRYVQRTTQKAEAEWAQAVGQSEFDPENSAKQQAKILAQGQVIQAQDALRRAQQKLRGLIELKNSNAARPGISNIQRGFGIRPFVHGVAGLSFSAVAGALIYPPVAAGTFTGWQAVIGILFALAGIGNFILAYMTADTPTLREDRQAAWQRAIQLSHGLERPFGWSTDHPEVRRAIGRLSRPAASRPDLSVQEFEDRIAAVERTVFERMKSNKAGDQFGWVSDRSVDNNTLLGVAHSSVETQLDSLKDKGLDRRSIVQALEAWAAGRPRREGNPEQGQIRTPVMILLATLAITFLAGAPAMMYIPGMQEGRQFLFDGVRETWVTLPGPYHQALEPYLRKWTDLHLVGMYFDPLFIFSLLATFTVMAAGIRKGMLFARDRIAIAHFRRMDSMELQSRLGSPSKNNRVWAMRAISAQGQVEMYVSQLLPLVREPHTYDERAAAIEALAKTHSRSAIDALIPVAASNQDAAQEDAIVALGDMFAQQSAKALLGVVEDPDSTWEASQEAIYSLLKIGQPESLKRLGQLVEHQLMEHIRTGEDTDWLDEILEIREETEEDSGRIPESTKTIFAQVQNPNAAQLLQSKVDGGGDADAMFQLGDRTLERLEAMTPQQFKDTFGSAFAAHPAWLKESMDDNQNRADNLLAVGLTRVHIARASRPSASSVQPGSITDERGFGINEMTIDLAMGLAGLGLALPSGFVIGKMLLAGGTVLSSAAILPALGLAAGIGLLGGALYGYIQGVRHITARRTAQVSEDPTTRDEPGYSKIPAELLKANHDYTERLSAQELQFLFNWFGAEPIISLAGKMGWDSMEPVLHGLSEPAHYYSRMDLHDGQFYRDVVQTAAYRYFYRMDSYYKYHERYPKDHFMDMYDTFMERLSALNLPVRGGLSKDNRPKRNFRDLQVSPQAQQALFSTTPGTFPVEITIWPAGSSVQDILDVLPPGEDLLVRIGQDWNPAPGRTISKDEKVQIVTVSERNAHSYFKLTDTQPEPADARPAAVDSPAVKPGAVRQETLDAQIKQAEQYVSYAQRAAQRAEAEWAQAVGRSEFDPENPAKQQAKISAQGQVIQAQDALKRAKQKLKGLMERQNPNAGRPKDRSARSSMPEPHPNITEIIRVANIFGSIPIMVEGDAAATRTTVTWFGDPEAGLVITAPPEANSAVTFDEIAAQIKDRLPVQAAALQEEARKIRASATRPGIKDQRGFSINELGIFLSGAALTLGGVAHALMIGGATLGSGIVISAGLILMAVPLISDYRKKVQEKKAQLERAKVKVKDGAAALKQTTVGNPLATPRSGVLGFLLSALPKASQPERVSHELEAERSAILGAA